MNTPEYSKRLRVARAHADLTQAELAQSAGCTQVNISKLEQPGTTGSDLTVQFALACRVTPIWLATGGGEMFNEDLAPDEQTLIEQFRLISVEEQKSVMTICAAFVGADKNPQTR